MIKQNLRASRAAGRLAALGLSAVLVAGCASLPPGEDIAPYHNRQIALLTPPQWMPWLDHSAKSVEMLSPNSPGTLNVSAATS